MSGIADMTRRIVDSAKKYEYDTIPGDFGTLKVPCPKCGGEIHERYKQFQCEKCDFAFWKTLCSRMFEPEEVEKIITEKVIGPLQGFRSKQGFPFAAVLKMTPSTRWNLILATAARTARARPRLISPARNRSANVRNAARNVFDGGMNYVCEKQAGAEKTCEFRTGKIILQQEISPEQVKKLLAEGKTDLLKGFVSNKTNRKFEAYLIVKDGKTGFEFKPREKKGKAQDRRAAAEG